MVSVAAEVEGLKSISLTVQFSSKVMELVAVYGLPGQNAETFKLINWINKKRIPLIEIFLEK